MIEGKCSKGKQSEKTLNKLTKWLKVGHGTDPLKATKDRDVWKVIITYIDLMSVAPDLM